MNSYQVIDIQTKTIVGTYGNQTTCQTSKPPSTTAPVYYVDANANNRGYAVRSCMNARGYTYNR